MLKPLPIMLIKEIKTLTCSQVVRRTCEMRNSPVVRLREERVGGGTVRVHPTLVQEGVQHPREHQQALL